MQNLQEKSSTASVSSPVQSIFDIISKKKKIGSSSVDSNLLSKVANVINLSPVNEGKFLFIYIFALIMLELDRLNSFSHLERSLRDLQWNFSSVHMIKTYFLRVNVKATYIFESISVFARSEYSKTTKLCFDVSKYSLVLVTLLSVVN